MNNIADDIKSAYHDGYEQGRFDGVMDITNGLAACRGYDIMAVVRCKNCQNFDTTWTYCGSDVHYCRRHRIARREEEFCSDGMVRDE